MINNKNNVTRKNGFSLVEVLIALVIMSVGMLGIMGLYVQSMQAGRTSLFRHHAVTLAGDVADRIRANPTAGVAYATTTGTVANNCVAGGVDCTPVQMAAHDIFLWEEQAGDTIPSGTISVVFTASVAGAPPTYLISVNWVEPGVTPSPSYAITIPVLAI